MARPLTLFPAVARHTLTDAGYALLAASVADSAARSWMVDADLWRQLATEHRRPQRIDPDYDPELHRYDGRCCS